MTRLAVLVVALTVAGCGRSKRAPRPQKPDDSANQAVLAKLQPYMRCLDFAYRTFEISDAYRRDPSVIQSSLDPEKCLDEVREVRVLSPLLPELDAAGQAYIEILERTFKLTTEAVESAAKLDALRPRLAAAFDEFDTKHARLFDVVFELNRSVNLAGFAAREASESKSLALLSDRMMLLAEDLVRDVAVRIDQLDRIDTVTLGKKLTIAENAVEEAIAYSYAKPEEADALTKTYWVVRENARAFIISVRQLLLRAQSKVAFSDAEKLMIAASNERGVVGSPAAAVHAYNQLVDGYHPNVTPAK